MKPFGQNLWTTVLLWGFLLGLAVFGLLMGGELR